MLAFLMLSHMQLSHVVVQAPKKDSMCSVDFGGEEAGWVRGSDRRSLRRMLRWGGMLRFKLCPVLSPVVIRG